MPLQRKLRWFLIGALVLVAMMGAHITRTLAQAAASAYLSSPETSEFPNLSAFLDVIDAQGGFVADLNAATVTIIEDGVELPLIGLQAMRPGVQFVVAITPGSALGIRDSQGLTRYQHLVASMGAGTWDEQADGQDDFSLITPGGAALLHRSNPVELQAALEAYQPPEQGMPSLEVLAQALEVAADPPPRPGMEQAVLFITPPQVANIEAGLQTLVARASQQNIHIFIWLVSAAEYFSLPAAGQLEDACAQTGGHYFAFSGEETVPDLETYLEPMRPVYRLVYNSQAAGNGPHQISAQVNLLEGVLTSAPQSFEVQLLPPDLVFIAPPVVISRRFAPASTAGELSTTDLLPVEQVLLLQVTFPDGYERELVRTTLIVDNMVVAENTTPPFDVFGWDLRSYTQDGLHTLRVEAEDSLGLVGQSPETVVNISVPSPEQGVKVAFERQRLLVVGLGILIAGSVLTLVLIIGGRIRPQAGGRSAARRKAANSKGKADKDPVTQPVAITPDEPLASTARTLLPGWLKRGRQSAQPTTPQPLAFLTPLPEAGTPVLPPSIPLEAEELSIGRDPMQANLVIDDPSVEDLHARLIPISDGFQLEDNGSIAGTWVNYAQIPPEGIILVHGDLVHLGRIGFRFTQREGGRRRKIVVQPLEPPE